jgi:predicted regulator of Ras-like GTPase activity (Roadblock/LC7/MglB family)
LTDAETHQLSEGIRGNLVTLKDVAGVAGSFVCTDSGRLLAREIPAVFEDGVLSEAGTRLLRMGEAFGAAGDDLDMAVVRYGEQRVYLKWISGGLLCVVVSGRVNMPALRMAAALVCRRISSAVAQAEAASLPAPAVESALPPPSTPTSAATSPPTGAGPVPAPSATRGSYPGMRRFRDRAPE